MSYPAEFLTRLRAEQIDVLAGLDSLFLQCVTEGQVQRAPRIQDHLLHGAGRRLGVLRRTLGNIFEIFPPSLKRPLSADSLADVQINLHAFVINLYGIFDNWAWAFIIRHKLESEVGGRRKVGLFLNSTARFLAEPIRSYLASEITVRWHEEYLKNYRDALAHRIPLYIPPSEMSVADGAEYNRLEAEKVKCIRAHDWDRLERIKKEQKVIGRPCFAFLHSFSDEGAPRPILLHPQLLSDAKVVIEFGSLYFRHWHIAPKGAATS